MISSISVVLPFFNEEKRIKKSIKEIDIFLKKYKKKKIEIIFVNDGSNDKSPIIVKKFITKRKNFFSIKLLNSKKNFGKGKALRTGILRAKYEWVLTSDIDMSVPLDQIFKWKKKKYLQNKYQVYFGSRELKESKLEYKFHRKFLGFIFRFYSKLLLGINLKDTQCGYKLYKSRVAKKVFKKLKNNGFEHDLEVVMLLKKNSILIKELPVHWTHKNDSKLNIIFDPIKMLIGIFKISIVYRLIK